MLCWLCRVGLVGCPLVLQTYTERERERESNNNGNDDEDDGEENGFAFSKKAIE